MVVSYPLRMAYSIYACTIIIITEVYHMYHIIIKIIM